MLHKNFCKNIKNLLINITFAKFYCKLLSISYNFMSKESKPHIAFLGKRNNGKSSLINCLTKQNTAIVSHISGTTTDPVKKSMEIKGLGAVVLIDTAWIDDSGELGNKRVEKSFKVIEQIDLAILVVTNNSFDSSERAIIEVFNKFDVPFIVVHNKMDIEPALETTKRLYEKEGAKSFIDFSKDEPVENLIIIIKNSISSNYNISYSLLGGIISRGDIVLLITPIDAGAPEGRLILPQVQTIRDILDNNAVAITLKETEIADFLSKTGIKPKIVVTDSQIFDKVDKLIDKDVALTSFSIILARFKGAFEHYKIGTPAISKLKDGDRVLILESCTHHASCEDIGRVKLPNMLKNFTNKKLEFDVVAGLENLPCSIQNFALVIQCGGCVITRKQLINRLKPAIDANISITNYGMAIAYMHGIYDRAMKPFEN